MVKSKVIIPATVRNCVWNIHIGKNRKCGYCLCCQSEHISFANFECGHIVSSKNGGQVTLDNLRPLCSLCNKSMGTKNMFEFMEKFGFTNKNKKQKKLESLSSKEILEIANNLNIKKDKLSAMIDDIVLSGFDYEKWHDENTRNFTTDELMVILEVLKIQPPEKRKDTIKIIKQHNVEINKMFEIKNKYKNKKYFIKCYKKNNYDNIHVYFTNVDLTKVVETTKIYENSLSSFDVYCGICKFNVDIEILDNPFCN